MLTLAPWVKWPPCARDMPKMVSPGFKTEAYTAWLAWEPGVRLDIDIFCAKQLFSAVNRQLFDNINVFTAAVIAFARIAFSVFVGQL